ncbi:hypothetical protein ACLBXM_19930 [Xanthobacteraceae bacterium A53D]
MKAIITAAVLIAMSVPAIADSCVATADAKKLAGAARGSFIGKCKRDAVTSCTTQSADRKLAGAAKSSFMNKCIRDAVGAPAN